MVILAEPQLPQPSFEMPFLSNAQLQVGSNMHTTKTALAAVLNHCVNWIRVHATPIKDAPEEEQPMKVTSEEGSMIRVPQKRVNDKGTSEEGPMIRVPQKKGQ